MGAGKDSHFTAADSLHGESLDALATMVLSSPDRVAWQLPKEWQPFCIRLSRQEAGLQASRRVELRRTGGSSQMSILYYVGQVDYLKHLACHEFNSLETNLLRKTPLFGLCSCIIKGVFPVLFRQHIHPPFCVPFRRKKGLETGHGLRFYARHGCSAGEENSVSGRSAISAREPA